MWGLSPPRRVSSCPGLQRGSLAALLTEPHALREGGHVTGSPVSSWACAHDMSLCASAVARDYFSISQVRKQANGMRSLLRASRWWVSYGDLSPVCATAEPVPFPQGHMDGVALLSRVSP